MEKNKSLRGKRNAFKDIQVLEVESDCLQLTICADEDQ